MAQTRAVGRPSNILHASPRLCPDGVLKNSKER